MKPVSEMCPEEEFFSVYDYTPIVEAIGTVSVRWDEDNYQGDTLVLYEPNEAGLWGFLCFGWGSCSGCDELQACSTETEVKALADALDAGVQWLSTADMLEKFTNWESTEGQHWYSLGGAPDFVAKCIAVLSATPTEK